MKPKPQAARKVTLTGLHAYPEDYQHLLTTPHDSEIGVTTSDDRGEW